MTKMSGTFLNGGACDAGPQGEGMDCPSNEAVVTQQGLAGKYNPYPEYKNPGVEWLELSPSSWETKALKYIVSCNDEVLSESTNPDMEFEYIDIGGVSSSEGITRTESMKFSGAPSRARRIVRQGDIIVSTVRTYLESIAPISSEFDGKIASTGFAVLRPKYLLSSFAQYALRARHFIDSVVARSTGVSYPAINSSDLIDIKIVVPSWKEQQIIAAFLDYETARIDRLIAQQQRLIELLKEKRQAVISHAVTKGLNPDAPMKDSGVEWLGQVPEHWVISRIKNYAKIESGHTPSRQVAEYWIDCNIPWVSLNDSKILKVVDYISDTFYKINELGMANSSAHLLPERVVVFTRDASIGLAAITTIPMAVSQHLIAWVCNEKKVIPEYLLLVFYAMESEFERYTFGATIKTIGMDDVRSLTAVFPKIEEQKEIITWAFSKLEILKNALQKAEETISLLQERRTALISATVTGKIDLRGWTPPDDEVAA